MARPATYEAPLRRCRNTENFGDGSPALRLQTNRPKVWFAASLPGMPLAKLKEIFFRGVNKWALVANVLAVEAESQNEADWIIVPSRMDGKNGVLADMMMPGPHPQYMRLDVAENASEDQLEQTCLHEGGHGYGLFHTPAGPPAEVMDPSLNMSVRTPQAAEAKLMESMYGAPMLPAPPKPPSTGSVLTCVVRLSDHGKDATCSIEAAKPGYQMKLSTTQPKVWEPAPTQGLYVAPHQAMQLVIQPPFIEQDELADTDTMDEGELS